MHTRYLAAFAATAGLLVLAACGGGGGGTPATSAGDINPETVSNLIRTANSEKTLQSAESAAASLPRFGSVTQSSNHDANGVTTDRVSAAFDGDSVITTVTRADSSTLRLDTADAIEDTGGISDTLFRIPGGARTLRIWGTAKIADRGATVSRLAVTAANSDSTDWLVGGYWLHIAGQNLLAAAPTVTGAELGAFVDGPELESQPAGLPDNVTARYEGLAAGAYAIQYGSVLANVSDVASGSTEIGEFQGVATLTANFVGNTISGCIGCKGDVLLTGVFEDSATGAQNTFTDTPTDNQVHLGAAQIRPDGTFRVNDVTLSNANMQRRGIGVTEQRGSWGGEFSRIPVATGEPRLVAGTLGGRVRYSDGTRGVFVGAFGAGKQ